MSPIAVGLDRLQGEKSESMEPLTDEIDNVNKLNNK